MTADTDIITAALENFFESLEDAADYYGLLSSEVAEQVARIDLDAKFAAYVSEYWVEYA